MSRLNFLLLLWLGLIHGAAQIKVELTTNQDRYLAYEDIIAQVTIVNFSGRDIVLGESEDWLSFYVQSNTGFIVRKMGEVNVKHKFTIPNAQQAVKSVNISRNFDLTEKDQYLVQCVVKVPGYETSFVSDESSFYIVKGVQLWEQTFGVAQSDGNPQPELRKYSLYQATHFNKILLYFRLSDPDDHYVFKVYPIGTMVSFSNPQAQIDSNSRLHVLNQFGARSFAYYTFSPDGEKLLQQTFQTHEGKKPKIGFHPDKGILVYDGVRVPHKTDFPKSDDRFPKYIGNPLKPLTEPPSLSGDKPRS